MAEPLSSAPSHRDSPVHDLHPFTVVDYPGRVACTLFTAGCNLRCPYCHNADLIAPKKPSIITEQDFLNFLRKRKGRLTGVCITGGEPTLHDLTPLLKHIKAEGYAVKLDTNGTRPRRWISWVEGGLIDYIAMDVKAPLEAYPRMGASKHDIQGIAQSVQYLLSHPHVPSEFRTTLHPNWLSGADLDQIGEWLAGAKRLVLQPFVPSTKVLNPGACKGPGYPEETLLAFKNRLRRTIHEVVVRGY